MRVLDAFCNAGGASAGYRRAMPDAEIVGVDIVRQPRYPFTFVQGDAIEYIREHAHEFDLVHASPPCHDHSTVGRQYAPRGTGWMLEATIRELRRSGVDYVVENVEGARWPDDAPTFRLCGSSFHLDLRRHRRFHASFDVAAPPCDHSWQTPRFPSLRNNLRKRGVLSPVVGVHGSTQFPGDRLLRMRAMEIDWMTLAELNQALPPAYTEWIAKQWLAQREGGQRC